MFYGRKKELQELYRLKKKNTASLVCILGRRRIGKSALVEQYSKKFKSYISIQGLGPEIKASNKDQLEHFATRMSLIFKTPKENFSDWSEAFYSLAEKTRTGENLILFDEVSWLGSHDHLFAEKLKDAWDLEFKKNNQLVLVVCGSVSTWIQENILKNASFEGRISLQINLQELKLFEINQFWTDKNYHMGSMEKMLILSVTGGVPKYLEEILSSETAEKNLLSLCFTPSGILFNEYEKIFYSIFDQKKKLLEKIITICLNEKLAPSQIAKKLKIPQSGIITDAINILELSGFVSKDYYFKPDGTISKLGHVRIKDNYLRFYHNYILPNKAKILQGGKEIKSIFDLKSFESILGYQFENLMLANRSIIHKCLTLPDSSIVSSAPHVQKKKANNIMGCQIDLLIHTNLDVFFLCEIKCKKIIDKSIVKEVKKKVSAIKLPKRSSVKPVLIYEGEIYPSHKTEIEDYFFKIINFGDMLGYKD